MALPDSKPPSRLQILEQGGRLVVIDRLTGAPPPTAAERMKALDAERAEAERPQPAATATPPPTQPRRTPQGARSPAPSPWRTAAEAAAPAQRHVKSADKSERQITTRSWWDKKGPRTVSLSEQAEKTLMSGFLAIVTISALALILLWTALPETPIFLVMAIILLAHSLPTLGSALIDYGRNNSKKGQR